MHLLKTYTIQLHNFAPKISLFIKIVVTSSIAVREVTYLQIFGTLCIWLQVTLMQGQPIHDTAKTGTFSSALNVIEVRHI
jgi:hypothetical protein